ncbi:putative mitochondrial protein [Tanacetum coccineum]
MLLPLGGCEMVLGIQWLSILGTIEWNFKEPVMKFVYEGKKICLRGTRHSELQWMSGKKLHKKSLPFMSYVWHVATLNLMQTGEAHSHGSQTVLQLLLQDFEDMFAIPSVLSLQRSFDPKTLLKDESIVVNIRPYRYPPNRKDVIEAMVNELMETVKDITAELIDELNGAQVFSKLDLRSGYHQIRMREQDIFKTAFKSLDGHYKFVVMPFCLTNAPSTFQSLINSVFKAFIRQVLQTTREHTLFAKQGKCVFGTTHVEYLRHIISKQGVTTDPEKIKSMQNWPFVIKTDASGYGIGAVLQRNNRPIAFLSKTLALKHQSLYVYEKELSAVVLALQKWRGYLFDMHFKIKTDNFSLKYVLDQRITTPFQSKWLLKLLVFDYEIEYKQGKDNVVADALSRIQSLGELFSLLFASNSNEFMNAVTKLRKGKWVVGADDQLRKTMVAHFHTLAIGSHSGVQATLKRIGAFFLLKRNKENGERNCEDL